jgi:hypothetical protein
VKSSIEGPATLRLAILQRRREKETYVCQVPEHKPIHVPLHSLSSKAVKLGQRRLEQSQSAFLNRLRNICLSRRPRLQLIEAVRKVNPNSLYYQSHLASTRSLGLSSPKRMAAREFSGASPTTLKRYDSSRIPSGSPVLPKSPHAYDSERIPSGSPDLPPWQNQGCSNSSVRNQHSKSVVRKSGNMRLADLPPYRVRTSYRLLSTQLADHMPETILSPFLADHSYPMRCTSLLAPPRRSK